MFDIVVESLRAAVFCLTLLALLEYAARHDLHGRLGCGLIIFGYALSTFGVLIDITDNFESLNGLIVVGNTEVQAFLEKVVGSLLGSTLILLGFRRWLPLIQTVALAERRLAQQNVELERAVAERTLALEEESRAKSRYLASLSHEIRTPLNAILGFAEMMRDGHVRDDAVDVYRRYAGDIYDSGAHLLALLNDVIDVAKIEAGRMELAPEPVDLSEVATQAVRMFAVQAAARDIRLDWNGPDGPVVACADSRAVTQILINLLSNAVKFTPDGGQVSLAVRPATDRRVEVSVSDTGVGMPPQLLSSIVRPFERADNRYSKAEGGSGLGLAIVNGLVAMHGGRLLIKSDAGKGTIVTVNLPAQSPVADRAGEPMVETRGSWIRAPIDAAPRANGSTA